jgi:coproporphyrinogen III oxidase
MLAQRTEHLPAFVSADAIAFSEMVKQHQQKICKALEHADGGAIFHADPWERPQGGGGETRVIQQGNLLEKGGVNRSDVWGDLPAFMQLEHHTGNDTFFATGLSIVIHPFHPFVPIIHMNIRYFETNQGKYWFGGGIDLTPAYIHMEDARLFHSGIKTICDKYNVQFYDTFSKQAAHYFYLPNRGETRGIGGIFFDHLHTENTGIDKLKLHTFCSELADFFPVVYLELIEKNKLIPYNESNCKWQRLRRGRYAEFNLLYDRGTKFGLETNGRTESILMSLPPLAEWVYQHEPMPGSAEYETLQMLKNNPSWI